MEIYQIDRTEVFPRLAEGEGVYAINEFLAQNPFRDLWKETIRDITEYIADEDWNFIVCEDIKED